MAGMPKSPLVRFTLVLLAIGLFTLIGPEEKTLGTNARIVYLHGAWVWAAMFSFVAAGGIGAGGLATRRAALQRWSRSLGRTGLFFWITYLPISMWAMQTSWNGLFLAEPRWRLAMIFAISGLLLQLGATLLENPAWACAVNAFFVLALTLALSEAQNVMHPPSPILNSEAVRIQLYFAGLLLLTLILAWQAARWWQAFEDLPARFQDHELR